MTAPTSHLTTLDGVFYRAIRADRADDVLAPPPPESAGRYHRPGQQALYMSPSADWARIAVSGYMREDGGDRLVFPISVTGATVFDQRMSGAVAGLGVDPAASARPWRPAIAEGREALSWSVSDAVRRLRAHGLIDVSRHIPGGWHLVLFAWNAAAAPQVSIAGDPIPVAPTRTGPKWG